MVLVDTQAFGELAYLVSCPICQKSRKFFSQTALILGDLKREPCYASRPDTSFYQEEPSPA
jgi:hypothetical protein